LLFDKITPNSVCTVERLFLVLNHANPGTSLLSIGEGGSPLGWHFLKKNLGTYASHTAKGALKCWVKKFFATNPFSSFCEQRSLINYFLKQSNMQSITIPGRNNKAYR
jgi:hypothetical protein